MAVCRERTDSRPASVESKVARIDQGVRLPGTTQGARRIEARTSVSMTAVLRPPEGS